MGPERLIVYFLIFRAILARTAGVVEPLHSFDGFLWSVTNGFLYKRTREADPEVYFRTLIILELFDLDVFIDFQVLRAAHR